MSIAVTGEIVFEPDLIVPMRDGIGLATDVHRPRGDGPFPVLLERTPYNRSAPSRSERTAAVAQPRTRAEFAAYFVRTATPSSTRTAAAVTDQRGILRSI